MTYSAGQIIVASDYNGFAAGNSGANVNDIWGVGATDKGYGQSTTLANAAVGGTVTATQWASLNTRISSMASHTGTSITSRANPVVGDTISILSNLATDLTNITNNRGNAAASGTAIGAFTGSVSKTTATGSGQTAWTITWTQTITFDSAAAARYFWNAGGIVKLMYGKSSTGTDHDPDWNTLAGQCGSINITGRVAGTTNTIAGQAYTGTTRIGGSGGTQTTLTTTTGWYNLTPGAAATTIFQLNNADSPYTPEYIRTTAAVNAGSTVLTLVTTWVDDGTSGAGRTSNITGGTGVTSPATSIGAATAPTVLPNVIPPSTTYLTEASWGTPVIASTIS